MRTLWRDYNLSVVLALLFVFSWILQTWTGWQEFVGQQLAHGETPALFGGGGYVWTWAASTMENWQSEFLQLLTFVVLTSFLIHRGSHESKDTDEEFRQTLSRIEHELKESRVKIAELEVHIQAKAGSEVSSIMPEADRVKR